MRERERDREARKFVKSTKTLKGIMPIKDKKVSGGTNSMGTNDNL